MLVPRLISPCVPLFIRSRIKQAIAAGWQSVPIPEDVRSRIEVFEAGGIEVKVPWQVQTGIFNQLFVTVRAAY